MTPSYEIGPPSLEGGQTTNPDGSPFTVNGIPAAFRGKPFDPPVHPDAHQRYETFEPLKFYETHEREFAWTYSELNAYGAKQSGFSWGYQATVEANPGADLLTDENGVAIPSTPGPTYKSRYGESILVRRFNDLPPVGNAKAFWALPSTTSHLHNGHTASESDGNPQDWIDSGEFWDHHYGNFPSGNDNNEKLTTLWYHDHRLDFTAANVYAGLAGFYFLYDEIDTGFEDPKDNEALVDYYDWLNKVRANREYEHADGTSAPLPPIEFDSTKAWRLPSGEFDIPMIMQDVKFKEMTSGPLQGTIQVAWDALNTDGILGDQFTVNRKIRPTLPVKRRRYRFRILNGGPSRFYHLFMYHVASNDQHAHGCGEVKRMLPFHIVTGDGNALPYPITADSLYFSVAQRVDIIVDFSEFEPGDKIVILNQLEQYNGRGPSGRLFEPDPENFDYLGVVRFDVQEEKPEDLSRPISEIRQLRELPSIDLGEVKQERIWDFDYDGGLWTINGLVMDPGRVDAGIEHNSAEVWTFRNSGNSWSHPIHCHFTEFLVMEVNGRPYNPSFIKNDIHGANRFSRYKGNPSDSRVTTFMGGPRRDVATLLPGDEIKVFMRFKDFMGKSVMHCHNVVHEDHAMMIRWDILRPGEPGFAGSREASEVYPDAPPFPYPDPRPPAGEHLEERPGQATIQGGQS